MCRCRIRQAKLNRFIPGLGDAVAKVTHATGLDKLVTPMKWAYGVTTTPERFDTTLPGTLASLTNAGFPDPRLFIDLKSEVSIPQQLRAYKVTVREQNMGIVGNWILALWELMIREPSADRYALFQDDFVTYKNLRLYLESVEFPNDGYLNLYTFPSNEKLANGRQGFYRSNQKGKGAVALVFDWKGAEAVATSPHMANKIRCLKRGKKSVDGGIVTATKLAKRFEYVHSPSLVQHTGLVSSMGNAKHPLAHSFRGEDFDAMELLEKKETPPVPKPAPPPEKPEPIIEEITVRTGLMGPCNNSPSSKALQKIAKENVGAHWLLSNDDRYPSINVPPGTGIFHGRTANDFKKFLRMIDTLYFIDPPASPMVLRLAQNYDIKIIQITSGETDTGTGTTVAHETPWWSHFVDSQLILGEDV